MKNIKKTPKSIIFTILSVLMTVSLLCGCSGEMSTHRAQRKAARITSETSKKDRNKNRDADGEEESDGEEGETRTALEGAGTYELESMEVNGMNLDPDTLRMAGLLPENNFIRLNPEGTGVMCFEGNTTEFSWTPGVINLENEVVNYNLSEGRLSAQFSDALLGGSLGGDAKITYVLAGGSQETPTLSPDEGGMEDMAQIPEDSGDMEAGDPTSEGSASSGAMGSYEGDWIGVMQIVNGNGSFSSAAGSSVNVAARFAFDGSGSCTPYFVADMRDLGLSGFENIHADLDTNLGNMFLDGTLMGASFQYAAFTINDNAPAAIHIYLDNGTDSAEASIALRRFTDTWSDGDAPYPDMNFIDMYNGGTTEDVALDLGMDASSIPSKTNVSGNAR